MDHDSCRARAAPGPPVSLHWFVCAPEMASLGGAFVPRGGRRARALREKSGRGTGTGGRRMRVIRILGTLEPGGAQLSALWLSAALRAQGVATTLLAGDATPPGLELAARYGLPADAYRVSAVLPPASLQWTPAPEFAGWLAPRRARAARIGLDDGRLRDGRSSVEGLSAGPLPGLLAPRLTFAGRFRGDKAPDVLIEALALLPAPPPAYLVGDGPLRGALTQLIAARGLDTVVHLPGWSYEPARYIAGASVHVVPSREESWSQSAVLALGLGVPVVGTAVDGLAHTLAGGRGVLVPPEDPRALAGALARVLRGERPDPGPGRVYARQFTPSAAAAVYAGAYRQLRQIRRPRAAAAVTPAPAGLFLADRTAVPAELAAQTNHQATAPQHAF